MTVNDLIKELKKYPGNTPVIKTSDNTMEQQGALIDVGGLITLTCDKRTRACVDAFDHTKYEIEVYRYSNDGFLCLKIY